MQIKCDKKVNFTPIQFYENKELLLEGAEKIISLQALARTTSVETLSGEVRANYMLTIRVLYVDQDGMVEKREENYELTSTLRGGITANSYALVNTSVIGVEYQGVQNVKVRVMLEQKGFYIQNNTFEPCLVEGNSYKKKSTIVRCACPLRSAEFIIERVEKNTAPIGNVLCSDATIMVKKVSTATDICEIEGVVSAYYQHLSEGELRGEKITFPFNYELLAEGVKEGDDVRVLITPVSTTLTITELDNGSEIGIQILAEIKGLVTKISEQEYAIDAYSKEYELSLGMGEIELEGEGCSLKSVERLSASLPLEEINDAVEIVSVGMPWVGATNVTAKPDLMVEGVVCSEVVIKRENGDYHRVLAEIPYSFKLDEDVACSSDLEGAIEIVDLTARIRFGTTLEIAGEVVVNVTGSSENVISYLDKAEPNGERIKNDAVISVYLVGEGETLFDCAKALQSDEEELLALNPELDLPLKAGDKVLLYRPL